ncbi:phage tail protein [Brucella pseudintermedia]|uniref:phage tail protein n=1 Tax=Brucella pseudintermedia TaxID=370111 RepID=UPI00124ECF93|nr:phage tail protein [Brucella pseudintermedia]KAB2682967.1 phage tail protein [Brucella pseudintermedia]
MERQHLLGDDAAPTPLERVLSESLDKLPSLMPGVESLRGFKFNPPDQIVPYLVAEYGLNEIADYLPDLRAVLREGVSWQRLIGTPAAVHKALRWINHDGDIEEFPAKKRKWWWFQVHLPFEVRNTDFVRPMTQLVKASKPLRSEFARVTAGWDVRAFQLNKHRLNGDAFLNNWSGIRRSPGEPVLSLRVNQNVRTKFWPAPFVRVRTITVVTSFVRATYQLPLRQRISIFVASAGVLARYSDPAIQTFQNAPFVHDRFGKPASRAHIGFS